MLALSLGTMDEIAAYLLPLLLIQLLELVIQFEQILRYCSSLCRSARTMRRTLWHSAGRPNLLLLCIWHLRRRTGILSCRHIIAQVELICIVLSGKVVKHVALIRSGIWALWVRLLGQVLLDLLLHGLLHLLDASEIC